MLFEYFEQKFKKTATRHLSTRNVYWPLDIVYFLFNYGGL